MRAVHGDGAPERVRGPVAVQEIPLQHVAERRVDVAVAAAPGAQPAGARRHCEELRRARRVARARLRRGPRRKDARVRPVRLAGDLVELAGPLKTEAPALLELGPGDPGARVPRVRRARRVQEVSRLFDVAEPRLQIPKGRQREVGPRLGLQRLRVAPARLLDAREVAAPRALGERVPVRALEPVLVVAAPRPLVPAVERQRRVAHVPRQEARHGDPGRAVARVVVHRELQLRERVVAAAAPLEEHRVGLAHVGVGRVELQRFREQGPGARGVALAEFEVAA